MSENPTYSGPMPDEYVMCPYNNSHFMRPIRLAVHLISCSRNFPSSKLVRCVFNSTHIYSVEEMKDHIEKCPNRISMVMNPEKLPPSQPQPPTFCVESAEDWDAEPPAPTYDPQDNCEKDFVIRNPQGNPPKARREFRARERRRFIENNKF